MKPLKIAFAMICLAGAAYIALSGREEDPVEHLPDSPELATHWLCAACHKGLELTPKQVHIEMEKAACTGGFGPLTCPKCQARELWRAAKCQMHDRLYMVADVPGASGVCPECDPIRGGRAPMPDDEEQTPVVEEPTFDTPVLKRTVPSL
jgi:hypothetical protein